MTDPSTSNTRTTADPGSFRDPANQVLFHDGVVHRALDAGATAEFAAVSSMDFYRRAERDRRIIESTVLALSLIHI